MSPRQSKVQLLLFLLLIGLIIFVKVSLREVGHVVAERVAESLPPPAPSGTGTAAPPQNSAASTRLLGESIMEHYADPSRPPEEDLTSLAHTLDNFALLVKGTQPLLAGANEEIAAALQGKNPVHLEFLPKTHPAFNVSGQIIDRWGSPIFFHALAADRIDIRSAGPDKEMWTADDLHRKHDGRFLKGEALLAPSLLEETSKVK